MKLTITTTIILLAAIGCRTHSLTLTKDERLRYFDAQFAYQKRMSDLNKKDVELTGDLQAKLSAKNAELDKLLTPEIRKKQAEINEISGKIKAAVDPLQQQANIAAAERDQVFADILVAHNCRGCQLEDPNTAKNLLTPEMIRANAEPGKSK